MTRALMMKRVGSWAALFGAACGGRLDVLSDPPGVGADDLAVNAANSSMASSSGCDLERWRPGTPDTPRPVECGVCQCMGNDDEGPQKLVCGEHPCEPKRAIVECPTNPYSFDTTLTAASGVRGSAYHVELMGPGGCSGDESYTACYVAPNLIDNPLATYGFRVLTSSQSVGCSHVAFQSFDVDLTPMTDLLAPGSGLIEIGNGIAQLGALSCTDYQTLAWDDISRIDVPRAACNVDSDCVGVYGYTSCTFNGCADLVTNVQGAASLRAALSNVDEARCGPFFAAKCQPPAAATCDGSDAPTVECRDGWCSLAGP